MLHLTFIDTNGNDISGTDKIIGYLFSDYFSSNLDELVKEAAGDTYALDQWLCSAYLGPDSDGIGVTWDISQTYE